MHRVGYGAMQLAGDGVFGPPRDREEALRVLRTAVDRGVDHLDTAQYYGPGVANELIREALHPYPDGLAIVSKVAVRREDDEPDRLRAGIEDNLATLGTDRLAVVNLRLPDPSEPPGVRFDAQLAALVEARDEGLIDGIGLSNVSRRHLRRALDQTPTACVQNLFHLADQRSRDVLDECAAHGVAFVPFCPLGWPRGAVLGHPVLAAQAARLDATPARPDLAARPRPQRPAHPGHPHPRPPGRQPRRRHRRARRPDPSRAGPRLPRPVGPPPVSGPAGDLLERVRTVAQGHRAAMLAAPPE